jgi:hypothetical protein
MNLDNEITIQPDDVIIGLDISAGRYDAYIQIGRFRGDWRGFYESPVFWQCHFSETISIVGVDRLQEYNPKIIILEPTGPYSKFIVSQFKERNIPYLLVNQTQVKETRKAFGGTDNKDDAYDALLMVAVYQTQFVDNYNWRYWLEDRPEIIKEMRQILLDIQSANKKKTAAINAAKQRFARGEWIDKAKIDSDRTDGELDPDKPPAFWSWVANWIPTGKWKNRKGDLTRWSNEYAEALKLGSAIGISEETRELAYTICLMHSSEARLEQRLLKLLADPLFIPYHRVFSKFMFGQRSRAWILVRIFPFSKYLNEGKPIIDYTMGQKKKDPKHLTKKNRTLRRFRQALGLGEVVKKSGTSVNSKSKAKGSGMARAIMWLYVNNKFEMSLDDNGKFHRRFVETPTVRQILEYWLNRAYEIQADGSLKKFNGKALYTARGATMRKVATMVYSELLKELADKP